jgi:SAM-dependent methyltransferase
MSAAVLDLPAGARIREVRVPGLTCRHCGEPLRHSVVDLGVQPLCESFLPAETLNRMEPHYPLHTFVCDRCWLVQVDDYVTSEHIFSEYAYFSSFADSWVAHAGRYVDEVVERFGLGEDSFVVEVASNDGYLLRHVVDRGIPCLGVEPAANVARAAIEQGVPTRVAFFGEHEARTMRGEGLGADLIVANNVIAHVPDLHDFFRGFATLLNPAGVFTAEIQYLPTLIAGNQFDTIYHEHFCYYSLTSLRAILAHHGLEVFDVQRLPTHGGSIRVYCRHAASGAHAVRPSVQALLAEEDALGITDLGYYAGFASRAEAAKHALLAFLLEAKAAGKSVAGYGAPGKGNTLLNFCGIKPDLLPFTVDRNPYKHGRFLPGSRIPIHPPAAIDEARPDYLLILPWNFRDEIMAQMAHIRQWGGQFVIPIPEVEVVGGG